MLSGLSDHEIMFFVCLSAAALIYVHTFNFIVI